MRLIYKVVGVKAWEQAVQSGEFLGAEIDLRDGFIHFSTADQVVETVRRHFAGQASLLLIAIDADPLGDHLKWEISRGGDLFPHLYGALPLSAVVDQYALPLSVNGMHHFPPGFSGTT